MKDFIKQELKKEADSILQVADRIDGSIEAVVDVLFDCKGKVVLVGIGKTGHIARKISATFASTGTSSVFLHAAEGLHGDLGIVNKDDVVIAISYSGGSNELLSVLPYFKFIGVPIVAFTGKLDSALAKAADYVVDCGVDERVEQFGLVPTASTTVCLAVGDAIAVALLKKKNFSVEDFAKFHPGGTIGKRIFLKVEDLMSKNSPAVKVGASLQEAVLAMTSGKLGCVAILDSAENLAGVFTDGDLRRQLQKRDFKECYHLKIEDLMTREFKKCEPNWLAVDALRLMESNKIMVLPVVSESKLKGILHMHALLEAGVV